MGYHAELKYAVREIGLWPEHLRQDHHGHGRRLLAFAAAKRTAFHRVVSFLVRVGERTARPQHATRSEIVGPCRTWEQERLAGRAQVHFLFPAQGNVSLCKIGNILVYLY